MRGAFQIIASILKLVGEDTDHGGLPWLVSPPDSDNLECANYERFLCDYFSWYDYYTIHKRL